jgi:hypothetical protein
MLRGFFKDKHTVRLSPRYSVVSPRVRTNRSGQHASAFRITPDLARHDRPRGRGSGRAGRTGTTRCPCGVLCRVSRSGVAWARRDAEEPATFHLCGSSDSAIRAIQTTVPRWDPKNRVLSLGGRTVKCLRRLSPNQEAILGAFEEEGWPRRIEDPLPPLADMPPKLRLRDAIRWLNKDREWCAIRFFGDGTGQGICWRLTASRTKLSDTRRRAA